jgi:L-histidine N-alpha-methyltransferase
MTTLAVSEVRIEALGEPPSRSLADEVRAGLARQPRELPPKLLYDERGSALFDRITELPEYYPTRCERAILNRHAPEIVAATGAGELLELGSGVASKTRALLYAMAGAGTLRRYFPLDVDRSVVERSAEELTALYPGLAVHGLVGDFERDLSGVPPARGRRLIAFLGGTIGNLEPAARADLLGRLRALSASTDRLLLGADLVKEEAMLIAAYDDAEGITREFTANALRVVNRELDGDFDPAAFEPFARWDSEEERMELGVRARCEQRVRLRGLGEDELRFAGGEELRTEISSKFTRARLERELEAAGFGLESFLRDEERLFSVSLWAPKTRRGRGGGADPTGGPNP